VAGHGTTPELKINARPGQEERLEPGTRPLIPCWTASLTSSRPNITPESDILQLFFQLVEVAHPREARYRRRQRAFIARAVPGAFNEWKSHEHPDQGLRLRTAER
jgi:hypothetical protein